MNHWDTQAKLLFLCLGRLWPLRKSHRRSLLTFCRGRQEVESVCLWVHVCSYFGVLPNLYIHNETGGWGWGGGVKKWSIFINQVEVQAVACATAIFFYPLSMFPDIWHFLLSPISCSFNLISLNKYSSRGRGEVGGVGAPLCQMRSVDIAHQTGADQRPACAHAGRRIKPHHAQPPWQKKASTPE